MLYTANRMSAFVHELLSSYSFPRGVPDKMGLTDRQA